MKNPSQFLNEVRAKWLRSTLLTFMKYSCCFEHFIHEHFKRATYIFLLFLLIFFPKNNVSVQMATSGAFFKSIWLKYLSLEKKFSGKNIVDRGRWFFPSLTSTGKKNARNLWLSELQRCDMFMIILGASLWKNNHVHLHSLHFLSPDFVFDIHKSWMWSIDLRISRSFVQMFEQWNFKL